MIGNVNLVDRQNDVKMKVIVSFKNLCKNGLIFSMFKVIILMKVKIKLNKKFKF